MNEYKEGFVVNSKSKVTLRVSDKDMADVRLLVKHSYQYETSDFIRQAIKEKLSSDDSTPATSIRRLAMEQLTNELQNVANFGQYRSNLDQNKVILLHICGLVGGNLLKKDDPEYLDSIISSTNSALMDVYNVYEPYYLELKQYIQSVVKANIYKRLFAK